MSVKIEVKGKTWPEKYQKLLDRADELYDGSDMGRAVVWGILACLACARSEELAGKQVDTWLASLSFIMEAMLGGNQQVEKKQEAEKPEQAGQPAPAAGQDRDGVHQGVRG